MITVLGKTDSRSTYKLLFAMEHPDGGRYRIGNGAGGWEYFNEPLTMERAEEIASEKAIESGNAVAICDGPDLVAEFNGSGDQFYPNDTLTPHARSRREGPESVRKVMDALRKADTGLSVTELRNVTGLSDTGARKALRILEDQDLIRRLSGTAGVNVYVAASADD
jgi:hypothetical protein